MPHFCCNLIRDSATQFTHCNCSHETHLPTELCSASFVSHTCHTHTCARALPHTHTPSLKINKGCIYIYSYVFTYSVIHLPLSDSNVRVSCALLPCSCSHVISVYISPSLPYPQSLEVLCHHFPGRHSLSKRLTRSSESSSSTPTC